MKSFQFQTLFALIALILCLNDSAVSPKIRNKQTENGRQRYYFPLTLYKIYWKSLFLELSCSVAKYVCGFKDRPMTSTDTTTSTTPLPINHVPMTSTTPLPPVPITPVPMTSTTTTQGTSTGTTGSPTFRAEYIVVEEKLNWMEAHINCKLQGYELTTVEDEQEFTNLQGIIGNSKLTTASFVWTAGNDLFREGNFTWVSTGQGFTDFLPPGNIEPTGLPTEDCVFLYYTDTFSMFVMADYPCKFKASSICKKLVKN